MSEANPDLGRDAEDISVEQMERDSVARFAELPFYWDQFLDTKLSGHRRSQANAIGAFSNRAETASKITRPHNFFAGFMLLPPKAKGALHNHQTAEVFMPIRGRMRLFWGEKGDRSVELGPLDMISVPPGIFRGFENVGDEDLLLLGILEGPDPGRVTWSPLVEEQARRVGYVIDADGVMTRLDGSADISSFHRMQIGSPPEISRGEDEVHG